jgi:hypothetical protein
MQLGRTNKMKKTIRRMGGLSILALLVGSAGVASAQTMGPNVTSFNILGNTGVTLTGYGTGVNRLAATYTIDVGMAPGTAFTTTNVDLANVTQHINDTTAVTAQVEAVALDNSLTAAVGATTVEGSLTFPAVINAAAGINIYQFPAGTVTNGTPAIALNGTATSIVIFQFPTGTGALSLTDCDIVLSGGILPGNIYWQVKQAVTLSHTTAANINFPGTVISESASTPGAIAVTSSGGGSYSIGRLISLSGGVTVTQSGAGTLTVQNPTSGGGAGPVIPVSGPLPAGATCGNDYFWPSPVSGPTGNFQYCMNSSGHAIIKVYNSIGDIVAKLDNPTSSCSPMTGTTYACQAPLNTGRLAPGVYLYRVQKFYDAGTSESSAVKKFGVKH